MESERKESGSHDRFDIFGDLPKYIKTWEEFKRLFCTAWNVGDFYVRALYFLVLGWPILLAYVCAMGAGAKLTSALALIPFVAFALALGAFLVINAALLTNPDVRKVFKWIMVIIGVELTVGVYMSAMPLYNDPELVPLLVLVLAAILVISLSGKMKRIRTALWITLIGLTIIFIGGGRAKMSLGGTNDGARNNAPPPYSQGSYLENELIVKRECTADHIVPKRESVTYIKPVPNLPIINMVQDCRNDDMITRLEPGEEIAARHRDFGPLREKENRCSYNYCGDAVPVGGEKGTVTRTRFVTDLPFPEFPFGVLVFYIIDDEGKLTDSGYVSTPGGIVYLANKSDKQGTLFSRLNIMKGYFEDRNYKIQVGWDGSTIAHEIERKNPNPPDMQ